LTGRERPRYTQDRFSLASRAACGPFQEVKALKTPRVRDLVLLGMALVLTAFSTTLSQSQGALKGKMLPVVSTSDVIGYITPCG
jgi:hypothetical protein